MLYTLEELPIGTKVFIDIAMGGWAELNDAQLPPNLELVIIRETASFLWGSFLWGRDQNGGEWYLDENRWPIYAYQLPINYYQCFDCRTDFTGDLHYLCPSCRERVINGRAA